MAVSKNRNFAKIANDVGADGTLTANALAPDIDVGGATVANTRSALPLDGNSIGDQAYVTDTSRLYIWNGNGWFSTALVNTTPTITNAPLSVYNLYANGAPTIITLAATDEDGDTLTWSYSSASASGKATITQADNVFTITPLTDIADTSFTIDFQVTDGVNVSTASSTINIDNRAPVIGTAPAASYVLATDGSPTVITLAATDPDGGSITWSYAEVGLTNQATIAQNGNEFTITPATTPQAYADFTITFTASDSIESTSTDATTFSLTFILVVDAWSDTVLSIGTSSTNGLDNSTFIDRSTNAHTVTPTGSPVQTAFHPYLDNWSSYISSETGALCYQDDDLQIGTGDFTAEGWFWISADTISSGTYHALFDTSKSTTYGYGAGSYSTHIGFWLRNDYAIRVYYGGSARLAATSNTLNVNEWNHCALVRGGDTVTMYINGVSGGTFTAAGVNFNLNSVAFGVAPHWTTSYTAGPMYVGNFRLEVGNARYTANFTPSTTSFESTADTVFLKNYNNHQALIGGVKTNPVHSTDVEVSAFNPFGQESEYTVGENKGSGYFDGGASGKIDVASSSTLDFAGDFTVQFWVYFESFGNFYRLFDRGGVIASNNISLFLENTAGAISAHFNNTTNQTSSNGVVRLYEWIHIAFVRSGSATNNCSIYVNGAEEITFTSTAGVNPDQPFTLGNINGLDRPLNGYMSDFYVTSQTALYTSNFTPPTAPVGNTNASLYLPMDNAGIFDKTGNHALTPVGNTSTSTTQTKFADTAMYFDGSGDDVTIPNSSQFDFSNNAQFTLEFWMYPVSLTGNPTINFVGKWTGGSGQPQSWLVYYESGEIRFLTSNFVYPKYTYSTLNQWVHIAVTSDGTNLRLFTDGILRDTVTGYSITEYDKSVEIGNNIRLGAQQPFNGYIENLQILKGVAKYTANFTPPTQEQGRGYQAES